MYIYIYIYITYIYIYIYMYIHTQTYTNFFINFVLYLRNFCPHSRNLVL